MRFLLVSGSVSCEIQGDNVLRFAQISSPLSWVRFSTEHEVEEDAPKLSTAASCILLKLEFPGGDEIGESIEFDRIVWYCGELSGGGIWGETAAAAIFAAFVLCIWSTDGRCCCGWTLRAAELLEDCFGFTAPLDRTITWSTLFLTDGLMSSADGATSSMLWALFCLVDEDACESFEWDSLESTLVTLSLSSRRCVPPSAGKSHVGMSRFVIKFRIARSRFWGSSMAGMSFSWSCRAAWLLMKTAKRCFISRIMRRPSSFETRVLMHKNDRTWCDWLSTSR